MTELAKNYSPKEVEEKWLEKWLTAKLFKSTIDPTKESFSIALPPPNVTGNLHMGHAFGNTFQDVLIRYNRMNGKNVLWQAGTDHAGIGTQILVERHLSKTEKKRKEDIGREEFLKRVWAWKEEHGNQIIDQMKKMGCAMDYDRLVFTMDEGHTKAVNKVFLDLYKKGLIYRGKRIVNWCPKCQTSLSDLEVENENVKGQLYHILYPFDINDLSKGGMTVATTRPETLFGDVAICVNPNDGRFKKLVGSKVYLPIINKQIPIIADEHIKMEFGTGVVKTTPAHDGNDFEIFQRNKDEIKKYGTVFFPYSIIMDTKARIQDPDKLGIPEDLIGIDRYKAREATCEKLETMGLLTKIEEYDQTIDKHDRCSTQIEPYLSDQWYVKMEPLAKKAIDAVEKEKRIKFAPERYAELYLNWLKNIRDWCISRQLWWGHQIPVWYKKNSDKAIFEVGENPPDNSGDWERDPDVLDTWFSSALWPFATLGWPHQDTDDKSYFQAFYPTSVLATAREIINLWVSRMIFMGLEFAGDIPFKNVIIHPVVQTPDGKRMSKSKGNAIDPLEMIDKYGADANRFWYFSVGILGNQDVRFPGRKGENGWESDTLEQYRRFANKLWNAVRFVMQNIDLTKRFSPNPELKLETLTIADRWILHKYTVMLKDLSMNFETNNFTFVAEAIYKFTWDDFCDWYIEIAKKQFADEKIKDQTQNVLYYIIHGLIRALHPIMPFITEEIWSTLPKESEGFLLNEFYPKPNLNYLNEEVNVSFTHVIEATRAIRNLRQTVGIPWSTEITPKLFTKNDFEISALEKSKDYISSLIKGKVSIEKDFIPIKPSTGALLGETRIIIPLSGLVDLENMTASLSKKKEKFLKDKEVLEKKLSNKSFVDNAPKEKVDEVKQQMQEVENQIQTINEQVELLK